MSVVFSFATSTRLAWPRSVSVAFSSVRPTSSAITVPPVRMAMSSSIALRRSPKPGALTATVFRMPRMLLTTRVARASPSTVFGDDQQRTCRLSPLLKDRQQLANVADLLIVKQDVRILENCALLVGLIDEVGRQVATVELHAFDDFKFVVQRLAVFDGDHAFLADFVHRFGDDLADFFIGVGRDRADLCDFFAGGRGLRQLLQLINGGHNRLVDAALQVHRVHAGGDEFRAFARRST